MKTLKYRLLIILFLSVSGLLSAQKFRHPGIDLSEEDLSFIKSQVLAWNQPWKDAFERMKSDADRSGDENAFTYVLRGPYGKPDIGGKELRKGAALAYDCALIWYITGDKSYANRSASILDAWAQKLSGFDYNDAKLIAGWTGHLLCNAAEILRYGNSGWQQRNTERFTAMLQTVYLPLLRFYYPQANGNWDGAIIHSLLAIAVFTDNTALFNNAVDHFLHAPFNGSLFKYIYPGGQCQENIRDLGHAQLGLGEFAGAARIAFTQDVDLFSAGDNRLAQGFEFTARLILGEKMHLYGHFPGEPARFSDIYEHVYRHYRSAGIDLPATLRAADSVRSSSARMLLIATRSPAEKSQATPAAKATMTALIAGPDDSRLPRVPDDAIRVSPGESIQNAVDSAQEGRWIVATRGFHILPAPLRLKSGITLSGEGQATILFLNPDSGERDAIVNAEKSVSSITIRDLIIEGSVRRDKPGDPNSVRSFRNLGIRGGIVMRGDKQGDISDLSLINLTIRNCTSTGAEIDGASGLTIERCNFDENGSSVVPGPRLLHNLMIKRASGIRINACRLDGSPYGCGAALSGCTKAEISGCEIARNGWHGILLSECTSVSVTGNTIEASDNSGIMSEYLYRGNENITITGNTIWYNEGYGIESYSARRLTESGNRLEGNGSSELQVKISEQKELIMDGQ